MTTTLVSDYSERRPASFPGALIDMAERELLTGVAEEPIAFAMPLAQGANADDNVKLWATGDRFLGVSVRTHSVVTADEWQVGEHVRILTNNNGIWCIAPVAVAPDEQVHVIPGGFSNTGGTPINAVWKSTTAAGQLGKWRFVGETL